MTADLVLLGDYDVTYSPDDGGWYVSRYPDGATSDDIYPSRASAIAALRDGRVVLS